MITFTSTASFIIDDIRLIGGVDGHGADEDRNGIIGGAGPYCLFGTRVFLSQRNVEQLAYVAHVGFACPPSIEQSLKDLNITLQKIDHPQYQHPRARNTFNMVKTKQNLNDTRGFQFLTPDEEYAKIFRIMPHHLPQEWLQTLEFIHLCMSGSRCVEWVTLYRERLKESGSKVQPKFVWEPSPNSAIASEWESFENALNFVSVVSPNHEELAMLLSLERGESGEIDLDTLVERILPLGLKTNFVIRAGSRGCIVVQKSLDGTPKINAVPAFWTAEDGIKRVVDVTGAGNAFMGGLMYGLHETGHLAEAAIYGSVSASFVVEQFGPPSLTIVNDQELWNGETARNRLMAMKSR